MEIREHCQALRGMCRVDGWRTYSDDLHELELSCSINEVYSYTMFPHEGFLVTGT